MNILIAFQIALGGLVAGTDAGFVYNDFPMMNGHWLSPDLFTTSPWYLNFTENLAMVQFQHRLTSGFVAIAVISFLVRLRRRDMDAGAEAPRHQPALRARGPGLPRHGDGDGSSSRFLSPSCISWVPSCCWAAGWSRSTA